jgi:hypothetical protein
VRVFKNTWFIRFARKEGIADDELREAVNQIEAGQFDADLGGGVYKQRISREGEGKSSGYRVIVLFKSGDRSFFVYGLDMKKKYYSEASEAIHESARDLYEIGAITEAEMREFDESCLVRKGDATPVAVRNQPIPPIYADSQHG